MTRSSPWSSACPGLPARPGTPVPSGPAYSKARARSGEAPARAMFEADAARGDIPAGQDGTTFGLEVTAIDGTTMELSRTRARGGVRGPRGRRQAAAAGRRAVHSGTRRWIGAAIGGYHDGENALADELEDSFGPGMLNLADRGFCAP